VTTLLIRNFAQIESVNLEFGDLTVLVGPQATGKSLALQWFKWAMDSGEIQRALKESGQQTSDPHSVLDLVFGEGMAGAWSDNSRVELNGKQVFPRGPRGRTAEQGRVFFIPAHRALLLSEGWPAPFLKLSADVPVVARLFSQNLYSRFTGRQASALFPVDRILKEVYRSVIDQAVFHGGQVVLDKQGLGSRVKLKYGDQPSLPFMTWTAGQREFTPLLLGLYHVLPPRKEKKKKEIDWVVVEEPEMGLHPQAIAVFMLLVLDMLWRGYKVILSTHSPLILDVVWSIQELAKLGNDKNWRFLCDGFNLEPSRAIEPVMRRALTNTYRVHYLGFGASKRVTSQDITPLDPGSEDLNQADWGGLTGFSSKFGAAVRKAVNESE
jgi:hypothetical protein